MKAAMRAACNRRFRSVLVLSALALASCDEISKQVMDLESSETQDWSFIESVGGLSIDQPVRQDDGSFMLPVICDVLRNGVQPMQPTKTFPAFSVRETKVEIHDHIVELRIVTCMGDVSASHAPPAKLGKLEPGMYRVRYGDSGEPAAELGSFTIAP
jgi:hypothetical protein